MREYIPGYAGSDLVRKGMESTISEQANRAGMDIANQHLADAENQMEQEDMQLAREAEMAKMGYTKAQNEQARANAIKQLRLKQLAAGSGGLNGKIISQMMAQNDAAQQGLDPDLLDAAREEAFIRSQQEMIPGGPANPNPNIPSGIPPQVPNNGTQMFPSTEGVNVNPTVVPQTAMQRVQNQNAELAAGSKASQMALQAMMEAMGGGQNMPQQG